ncbi:unnamed protein product [Rhizoctonia solani]|uniref:Uncharacterized protein n=1 Tax=Rhizoctonia solani TaxID=456999 RepID=A0A8H3BAW6_9AGAM|nr:unnamed protein product [Rhizoctonia solani]
MSDNVFKEYLKQKMKADPGFLEKMMAQAAAETRPPPNPSADAKVRAEQQIVSTSVPPDEPTPQTKPPEKAHQKATPQDSRANYTCSSLTPLLANCLYLCAPRRAGSANPRKLIRRQLPKTPEPELEPEPEPEPESSKSPPDSNPPKKTLLENAELGPTTEKAAGEGAKSVTKGGQPSSELVHIDGQRVAKATKTKVPAQSDQILRSRAKK